MHVFSSLVGELLEGGPLMNNQCYGDILCSNCSAIPEEHPCLDGPVTGQDWIQNVLKNELLKIGGCFVTPCNPKKKIEQ